MWDLESSLRVDMFRVQEHSIWVRNEWVMRSQSEPCHEESARQFGMEWDLPYDLREVMRERVETLEHDLKVTHVDEVTIGIWECIRDQNTVLWVTFVLYIWEMIRTQVCRGILDKVFGCIGWVAHTLRPWDDAKVVGPLELRRTHPHVSKGWCWRPL